jgi:hypothetical protein
MHEFSFAFVMDNRLQYVIVDVGLITYYKNKGCGAYERGFTLCVKQQENSYP